MKKIILVLASCCLVTTPVLTVITCCGYQPQKPERSKLEINTDNTTFTANPQEIVTVAITNWNELTNVQIINNNPDIVTLQGEVTANTQFRTTKPGMATITFRADNANSKTITINVNKLEINTDNTTFTANPQEIVTVAITNWNELTNVQIINNNPDIVTLQGEVTANTQFKANKSGAATVTFRADNANSKTITININKLEIKTDKDQVLIKTGKFADNTSVTITNFQQLHNIQIKVADPTITTAALNNEGKITFTGSTYGPNKVIITADDVAEKIINILVNKISNNDVLKVSENIIATTHGVYNLSGNTIGGDNLVGLTADDILDISSDIIVTTKGAYYYKSKDKLINSNLKTLTKAEFLGISRYLIATTKGVYDYKGTTIGKDALSNLTPDEFLGISAEIVATTRGVYNENNNQIGTDVFAKLTRNEFLGLSDNIIATTRAVLDDDGNPIGDDALTNLNRNEFFQMSRHIIVTSRGIFGYYNAKSTQIAPTLFTNLTAQDILALSPSIIATTHGVYNESGNKIGNVILDNLKTTDDVLTISENIIATNKGVFSSENVQIGGDNFVGLTKNDILGICYNNIATTNGVYNKLNVKLAASSPSTLTKDNFLGISDSIIATTEGVYVILKNDVQLILSLNELKRTDFIKLSDNIIATKKGIFNSSTNEIITNN